MFPKDRIQKRIYGTSWSQKLKLSIGCLDRHVGEDRLIRMGRKLQHSNLHEQIMHPVRLPKKGKLTEMIIRWCYQKTADSGRKFTLYEIKTTGYWVI